LKKFIKTLFVFLLPIQLYILVIFIFKSDFFALPYINYNRSYLSTVKLINIKERPTSFILGNSRSLAITCSDWQQYLSPKEIPFHFDGSKENIFQIRKKLEYLVEKDYAVKNIIAVVDYETLNDFSNKGHVYQLHPEISGNQMIFHFNEIKAFLSFKFVASIVYHHLTKKHLNFMRSFVIKKESFLMGNFNDLFFTKELEIKEDSLDYYTRRDMNKTFKVKRYSKLQHPEKLQFELKKIKEIVDDNNINFKLLIVSPYMIEDLSEDYLILINNSFDQDEVYDFSFLKYKYDAGNFYEASHFRRHVGQFFLKKIYE